MGELLDYVKGRLSKQDKSTTQDMMEKSKVKNAVRDLCDTHLEEAGDVFIFESSSKDLPHVLSIITEEPLVSKYNIIQISPTLFSVKMKEIEL